MTREEIYNDAELRALERDLNARAVVTGLEGQPFFFVAARELSPRETRRVVRVLARLFPGHDVLKFVPLAGRN